MKRGLEADLNVCLFGGSEAWLSLSEEALRVRGSPVAASSHQVLVPVGFVLVASGLLCGVASPEKLDMMVKTREIIGLGSTSSLYRLSLPRPSLAVLLFLTVFHTEVAHGQSKKSTFQQQNQHDFLSELGHDIVETMEDLIGQENFRVLATNLCSMVWTVSSGISSGLHVVARILGEILTSSGMNGNHATQFLKLSPSHVQTLLLWGLTALIAYGVLSLLLSLIFAIVSRIMWALRIVFFVAGFFFIVSQVPDRSTQVLLLLALLTFHALLGRSRKSHYAGAQLEAKVSSLECQVEELQRKQRRSP